MTDKFRLVPVKNLFDGHVLTDRFQAGQINMIGFCFDGTACFRKGTVDGPDAIRKDAPGIETFSPYLKADLLDYAPYADLGNLYLGSEEDIEGQWQQGTKTFEQLVTEATSPLTEYAILTLGGEHSISYAPIKSYLNAYPDLVLLHLDAHADLRDGYEGYHFSHASIIRRALDHFTSEHQLIQYGIRSGTAEEYSWMEDNKTLVTSLNELIERLEAIGDERPIYLTLDLDFFDPGFFPGTGTPEPGGESFHSFVKINKILARKNFVGCDVVELSPQLDQSGNSAVFATKTVRELLLSLAFNLKRRKK